MKYERQSVLKRLVDAYDTGKERLYNLGAEVAEVFRGGLESLTDFNLGGNNTLTPAFSGIPSYVADDRSGSNIVNVLTPTDYTAVDTPKGGDLYAMGDKGKSKSGSNGHGKRTKKTRGRAAEANPPVPLVGKNSKKKFKNKKTKKKKHKPAWAF